MEEALEIPRAKDAKERGWLAWSASPSFKVSQGTLQALDSAAVRASDHFKLQLNVFASVVVERLGNAKQPISDATRRLLLTLIELITFNSWNCYLCIWMLVNRECETSEGREFGN
ncbi:hypothetical protein LR48_Vigan08g156300 [Vigna angularis]|uniref:Uncharacterized protein n=1 Tax=Phaseolus angularis TaxID=3914 RepID=A0A0L9V6Q9_PHAAN|nr:hypothetical protein LR48_Vigan08g156300 [Vigna angularis]